MAGKGNPTRVLRHESTRLNSAKHALNQLIEALERKLAHDLGVTAPGDVANVEVKFPGVTLHWTIGWRQHDGDWRLVANNGDDWVPLVSAPLEVKVAATRPTGHCSDPPLCDLLFELLENVMRQTKEAEAAANVVKTLLTEKPEP